MPTGGGPPPAGGLALDDQERLYISDTLNNRIRRVDFTLNIIETVVGNGTATFAGDGGDPLDASLNLPMDIEFGPDGKLYIADEWNHRVRVVDFDKNTINTVVGNGTRGYGGDDGPAIEAMLNRPRGIAFDQNGDLYVADTWNNRIRKVDI
jgi:sugar lactone lactonase YvrE